jgi:hypothetical protein
MTMGLYFVFATGDLRPAVSTTGSSFYMPFSHFAVVSYDGSADELVRRLDLDRTGGPGMLMGCITSKRALGIGACLAVALLSYGVLI